jgi:hypothetical protein
MSVTESCPATGRQPAPSSRSASPGPPATGITWSLRSSGIPAPDALSLFPGWAGSKMAAFETWRTELGAGYDAQAETVSLLD